MLSRIAESIYWMSRYLERADHTARLMQINLRYLLEAENIISEEDQWSPLLSISGSEAIYFDQWGEKEIKADSVIRFIAQEEQNSNSILSCLLQARSQARIIRDKISKEMWEIINELWLNIDDHFKKIKHPEKSLEFYNKIIHGVAHFHGSALSTMMRGEAFGFYSMGTFVERADMTARILDVKYHLVLPDLSLVGSPLDYYQWAALLKSLSGFEAYRSRVKTDFNPIHVAEFIIFEPKFPRSLYFSVNRMEQALGVIGGKSQSHSSPKAINYLSNGFFDNSIHHIFFEEGLHEFLQSFLKQVSVLHSDLSQDYFQSDLGQTGEEICDT